MAALTTAYVAVLPEMRRFAPELKAGLRRVDVTSSGRDAGNRFTSGFGDNTKKALKRGLIGAGVAAGVAFGGALKKGFGRLSSIEDAEAKLTGLGHSAKNVDKIMTNALASVKGTAFGLDEAATVAATAVASGIKPGKELERTLRLTADAATIGGSSLGEMGAIFSKVAASNKIQGDTINQLNERGIPILKLLGDVMGKSQGEVAALASKGKVDFATFQKAMEKGLGGAALKSGNTATGAFKNMGAAFSRVGAVLLKGVFPKIGAGFNTVTGFLDRITPAAERFGAIFGGALSKAAEGVGMFVNALRTGKTEDEGTWFETIALAARDLGLAFQTYALPALRRFGDFIREIVLPAVVAWVRFMASQWMPIIRQVGAFFLTSILPAFKAVVGFIITNVVPGFLAIVETIKDLYRVIFPIISQIVGVIIDKFTEMRPQIMSIWNSVKEIITGVMFIIREVIASVTHIIQMIWDRWGEQIKAIVGTVFKAMFNIIAGVMKAIAGIIKLVVALIKGDWKGAWNAIKQIFAGVWQAIRAILNVATIALRIALAAWWAKVKALWTSATTAVRNTWTTFWAAVKKTGSDAINAIRTTIDRVLGRIRDGFARGVTAIGRAWDKIKATARTPVAFVVNTVLNDGLLKAFRAVSRLVDYGPGKNFTVSMGGGSRVNSTSGAHAKGGILPGYTPGKDVHRFVSASGGVLDLSGGEGIARPEIVRAMGKKRWDAMNREAMHGKISRAVGYLGGFFLGGQMPVPGGVSNKHSGYPWATWAGDLRAGMGTPVRAWNSGQVAAVKNWNYSYGRHVRINHPGNKQTLYAHLQRAIVRVGQSIGRGNVLGYSDSTGNSTGPHLHFELKGGQGVLGGKNGAGALAPLIDAAKYIGQVTRALGKLKGIAGSQFGQMVSAGARLIGDKVKDKITSLVSSFNSANAGTTGAGFTSVSGGSNRAIGRRMMLQRWPASQWPALNSLWTKESGWRTTARNPSSGAYGIPQSLPASKMASAGADWRTNPATQIKWGLGYIASRYGSPSKAWAHSQRTNWYDQGGWLPPGLSLAYNGTGKPERVTPPGGGRPITIILDFGDGLVQKIQSVIDDNDEFRATVGRTR